MHFLIERWVEIFQLNTKLYARLVNDLPTRGNKWKADARLTESVTTIAFALQQHRPRLRVEDVDLAAEILVRGIQSYFDHAIVNEPENFSDPAFTDRITLLACQLVLRNLNE